MARIKKTALQQEQELIKIIEDAKNKLTELHQKRLMKLGDLAIKHGLDEFELSVIDAEFKQLANKLKNK